MNKMKNKKYNMYEYIIKLGELTHKFNSIEKAKDAKQFFIKVGEKNVKILEVLKVDNKKQK